MQQAAAAERGIEVDRRIGPRPCGTVEHRFEVLDLSDDTFMEEAYGASEHRMEHVVEALRQYQPACLRLVDHLPRLAGVHADRLLGEDVQSTLERAQRPLA